MPSPLDDLITRQDIADLAGVENLIFDDADRIGVLEATASIDVQACPGSGKTTLIAAKLMLLAKKWPFGDCGICVLSHTNVAKDEIIRRLKKSKTIEAQNLLSYPHFIGTIQEFVNRFLALPALRSSGVTDITVDNDEYVKIADRLLQRNEFAWFRGTLNGLGSPENIEGFLRGTFRFCVNGGTDTHISRRPRSWQQANNLIRAQTALGRLKRYLDERGFYLFRDMYTQAAIVLRQNQALAASITSRFPCVFIDEMQDTQKFQDELLSSVFDRGQEALVIQRFGDPDQAIFHGIGSEEPNESFNGKSADNMDFVIHRSHRFTNGVAEKIAKLSFNAIPLESELSNEHLEERRQIQSGGNEFENTILVFDDDSIDQVIPTFLDTVSQQFSNDYVLSDDFSVKIIGAVGNEITQDGQLKIGHYWPDFDKQKSSKNFRENTLVEAVRYCRQRADVDWTEGYKLLSSCITKLLRSADIRDPDGKYFNATTLRDHLTQNRNWVNYRELLHLWLNPIHELDRDFWDDSNRVLGEVLNLNGVPDQIRDYLAFSEPQAPEVEAGDPGEVNEAKLIVLPDNVIRHPAGFTVELSTIHGVKGETHDATLVLETKNHCFDLETMLPYLAGDLPSQEHPNTALRLKPSSQAAFKPNQTFMRQFYVGVSRPKHLLGLAIHADRISEEQRGALIRIGWSVNQLAQAEE